MNPTGVNHCTGWRFRFFCFIASSSATNLGALCTVNFEQSIIYEHRQAVFPSFCLLSWVLHLPIRLHNLQSTCAPFYFNRSPIQTSEAKLSPPDRPADMVDVFHTHFCYWPVMQACGSICNAVFLLVCAIQNFLFWDILI